MILVKEITNWQVEHEQPNHIYLMDDKMNKVYGYFKWNNPKDFMMFKNPRRLDKRYRQFKTIKTGLKMKGVE